MLSSKPGVSISVMKDCNRLCNGGVLVEFSRLPAFVISDGILANACLELESFDGTDSGGRLGGVLWWISKSVASGSDVEVRSTLSLLAAPLRRPLRLLVLIAPCRLDPRGSVGRCSNPTCLSANASLVWDASKLAYATLSQGSRPATLLLWAGMEVRQQSWRQCILVFP